MQKLPMSDLKWLKKSEIKQFDINNIDLEGSYGYILEVDLSYPKKLHLKHNNLPLAPEILQVNDSHLSNYAKKALIESDGQKKYKDVKLIASFHDREKYVIHAKNLKLYLDLGMKLNKIHRAIKFKQEAFIAPFIEKCTAARISAKTKFSMDQFKKLANSTYGKTLQDVRNYSIIKIHTNKKSALKAVAQPTYKSFSIISNKLIQTSHFTPVIKHDKPIFIGFTILELVSD